MKPVWLLDIDGVVNAATKKPDRNVWPLKNWLATNVEGMPILASRNVLGFLREVHATGRAEIWWHTTWQESAQHLADALDLPTWPVRPAPEFADFNSAAGRSGWWKLPAAERVVQIEKRPLIWTDDDITWSIGGRYDVDANLRAHAPALLVSPNERTGLTPKHLRQIGDFLNIHSPIEVTA